jgi:hypothetical protein
MYLNEENIKEIRSKIINIKNLSQLHNAFDNIDLFNNDIGKEDYFQYVDEDNVDENNENYNYIAIVKKYREIVEPVHKSLIKYNFIMILELFNRLNRLRGHEQLYIARKTKRNILGMVYIEEYESTTLECLDDYVNHFFDKIKRFSERVGSCKRLNLIDCILSIGPSSLIAHFFNLFTTKVRFANDAIFNKDVNGRVLIIDDSTENEDAINRHIETTQMIDDKKIKRKDVRQVQNSLKEILKYFLGNDIENIISYYPIDTRIVFNEDSRSYTIDN